MNSSAERMMEFLHFIEWTKSIDRSKKHVMVNPIDPDHPFIAYHDGEDTKYGWANIEDSTGVYTVEFE